MIRALSQRCNEWAQRWMPDPFVFAILLTFVTLALAILLTDSPPRATMDAWETGFWSLLAFGMQMSLILVTGSALAGAPIVRRLLVLLASVPRTAPQAAAFVAAISMLAALVNWGLGLIVGALLARETALAARKRGIAVDYPLLAATGYTGLMVWHGGLSGSAPISVASKGHSLEAMIGVIPISETTLSTMNLMTTGTVLIAVTIAAAWLMPPAGECRPIAGEHHEEEPVSRPKDALEGPGLAIATVLLAVAVLGRHFAQGKGLDLNTINLLFLTAGLAVHGNLRGYLDTFTRGASGAAGILLQFPFYGGIAGVMSGTGLVNVFSDAMASVANQWTFPGLAYLSAALVNFFVPSGGGQWVVQGPLLLEAGKTLAVENSRTVMALAYGDQLTNMAQPFWAIALLSITGLKAADIAGYCLILMLVAAPVYLVGISLLPM